MTTQSKLAVILHADVVGSTVLVRKDEKLAHDRIRAAFQAFSDVVRAYDGTVKEVRGDALVAEFSRASDAVLAALAAQEANVRRNAGLKDEIVPQLRVGIALGEVVIADGTVTGAGVVLAQRLEQLAEAGGVCVQGSIYEAVPRRLPFEYTNLGEQALKGFEEPVRAYEARLEPGSELPAPAGPTRAQRRARHLILAAAIGLLLVLGIVVLVVQWTPLEAEKHAGLPLPDKPSIAVLPFENLSDDPEQEYFSDGVTNDIITDLSKFHSLLVIAGNSVFTYKGKPVRVQDVSKELGVRYVLEGSVQIADEVIRINAQLIDATTGYHVWGERYDRPRHDLFVLQEEIVQTIVRALALKVDAVERKRVMRMPTGSLEAYDYVLRGREFMLRRTRSATIEARRLFQRAIDLDSRYAGAYIELGWTYRIAFSHGWTEFPGQALQTAHELAQQALSLDESAGAHRLLGSVQLAREQYALAVGSLERAIALNPNDWDSKALLGVVMLYTGRPGQAVDALATALRFNPNIDVDRFFHLGLAYYLKGRYDDSIRTLERGIGRNPEHPFLHIALAAAYAQAGRSEEARQTSATVRRLHPFFEVDTFGTRFSNSADRASIAEGLRKAGLK